MENNDFNKYVEGFIKWSKMCIITAIGLGFCALIFTLLTLLKEFTDFEVKAPYLYNVIFVCIMLAISLALVTLMIICFIKARKYKKLIEQSETYLNEYADEQTDRDA